MSNSYFFTNKNGVIRIGTVANMNLNDGIIPPITFTVNSITYAGATQATFSNSLLTGNKIVNSNNTSLTYNVYAFGNISSAGTYVINYSYSGPIVNVYVLAVGGGGGGGSYMGGGGGGGGVVMYPVRLNTSSGTITISIGAGGLGAVANGVGCTVGGNTTVTFSVSSGIAPSPSLIIAYGGGSGGSGYLAIGYQNPTSGGSGGGVGYIATAAPSGNNTNNNYANSGSASSNGPGGGAGSAGYSGNGSTNTGTDGLGGDGIKCSLPGIIDFIPSTYSSFGSYYWAGGGGGPYSGRGGTGGGGGCGNNGGANGGGSGGISQGLGAGGVNGTSGAGGENTGGGGGAGWNRVAGVGGTGVVVIAFPTSSFSTIQPLNNDANLIIWYTFESGTYTSTTLSNMASGTAVVDAVFSIGSSTQIKSTLPSIMGSSYLVETNSTNIFINRTVATTIGTNGFTLAFWFFPIAISGEAIIAQIGGTANAGPGIYLAILNSTAAIAMNSASSGYGPSDPNTVNTYMNTWVHKVFTVTSANVVTIYHNGVSVASATGSTAYPFTSSSYFNGFLFGSGYCTQNTTTVTTSGGSGYNGSSDYTAYYDDVRVYSRALTSTEVVSLFNYR